MPERLIDLADEEGNSVTVTVQRVNPDWPSLLIAELEVRTPFLSGSLRLGLSTMDLDSWEAALRRLEGGQDAGWMEMGRGPSLAITLDGARDCPEVVVDDVPGSMVIARIPIDLPADWIAGHHRRLSATREHWPLAPLEF